MNERQARYKLRAPWVRFVEYARRRCNGRHTRPDTRRRYAGVECTITAEDAKFLWLRDNAHAMLKPSLDRLDPAKGYTRENCQFMEHDLNSRKAWDKNIARTMEELLPDWVVQNDE